MLMCNGEAVVSSPATRINFGALHSRCRHEHMAVTTLISLGMLLRFHVTGRNRCRIAVLRHQCRRKWCQVPVPPQQTPAPARAQPSAIPLSQFSQSAEIVSRCLGALCSIASYVFSARPPRRSCRPSGPAPPTKKCKQQAIFLTFQP